MLMKRMKGILLKRILLLEEPPILYEELIKFTKKLVTDRGIDQKLVKEELDK